MATTERRLEVEVDGKKHQIPVPDGFVHVDDLKETHLPKDHFMGEVQRRVDSLTKELRKPDDLIKDDEFLKKVTDARRDDLVKILDIKVDPKPDVGKIQTEAMDRVRREELEPLKKGIKDRDDEVGLLRVRDLDAQVAECCMDLHVVADLRELVKMHIRSLSDWEPERKQWFIKKPDGSGFELSSDPKKGGHPYEGIRERMEKLARDPSKKAWFTDQRQPGGNFQGSVSQGRNMTLEQYQKLTPSERTEFAQNFSKEFEALMAERTKQGEERLFAGAGRR